VPGFSLGGGGGVRLMAGRAHAKGEGGTGGRERERGIEE